MILHANLTSDIEVNHDWTTSQSLKGYRTNATIMSDLIVHDLPIARDEPGNLYYYKNGVYLENGEAAIDEMYRKNLQRYNDEDSWTSRMRGEIIKYIGGGVAKLEDRPDLCKINLLNGIYNWADGTFEPHTPEYRTTVQIPIHYDPSAKCPYWDQFLYDVFPYGVSLLQEVIALCMIPYTGLHKCIVLVGDGSNGKSSYLSALRAAVGAKNCCAVPLHKLTSNQERFNSASLMGKLVNIFGDLSPKAIDDTANFKALTGEDTVTIEFKGKQPFSYTPFCRLIFSCKKVVTSDDDESTGYKRRFINIPFQHQFSHDPAKGLEIKDYTESKAELSGLFNRLIPLFSKLVAEGFTITPEIASVIDNYAPIPKLTKAWLISNVEEKEDCYTPCSAFYDYYCTHCPCSEPFERGKLVTYMKNVFPSVVPNYAKRLWSGEQAVKCYKGVRLTDNAVHIEVIETAWKLRADKLNASTEN